MSRSRTNAINRARQVKHRLYVAWKYKHYHLRHLEPLRETFQRARPVPLSPELARSSFLAYTAEGITEPTLPLPRRVFTLWTGDNEMSAARRRSVDDIRNVLQGLELELVTPTTLEQWVIPEHPLHPSYPDLSYVHRSDYLRAYLLHHHGGGYIDVKRPLHSWLPVIAEFEAGGYWFAGYPEIVYTLIPKPMPFDNALRRMSRLMTGQGAFLAHARTPFTAEWMRELHARLDRHSDVLRAHPGDAYGINPGYPITWTEILAEITEPLEYKYADHVLRDRRLLIRTKNYR